MNSERYMPSIFPECDKLKESYDKCFTTFFQQYVNSEYRHRTLENPCKDLFKRYRDCVEEGLKREKPFEIDLEEVRKEILSTKNDNFDNKEN